METERRMAFPIVCEIPFSNALIIDNKPAEIKSLEADLKKEHFSHLCKDFKGSRINSQTKTGTQLNYFRLAP